MMGNAGHRTVDWGNVMESLQPSGWPQPHGYANGIIAEGRIIFVAGQIGWNARGEFETDDFVGQVRQTLLNVVAVLAEGDGQFVSG